MNYDSVFEEGVYICFGMIIKGDNRIPCMEKVKVRVVVKRAIRNKQIYPCYDVTEIIDRKSKPRGFVRRRINDRA